MINLLPQSIVKSGDEPFPEFLEQQALFDPGESLETQ